MTYAITEWPTGRLVATVSTLTEAATAARACYQAQITILEWSGYVTTWAEGGASARHFPDADRVRQRG